MSEVNNGIRFDIYERVHLPDNVAAIDELEEIELVPRIQVVDQGEHAVLQGQLVLNGIYRAQGSVDEQVALEHWIPVEISLPMNRVTRLEEITVDIDTFDVVLLSSRTLNITGILSLRGISLEQEEEENVWSSEAFVATHDRTEEDEQYELQSDDQLEYRYEASGQEEADEASEEVEAEEESEQFFASYLQQEQADDEFEAVERDEQSEYAEVEQQQDVYEYAIEAAENDYAERDDESAYANQVQLSQEESEQYTADAAAYEQYEYETYREEAEEEQDEQYSAPYIEADETEQESLNQEREMHIALSGNTNQNETLGIRSILNSSLREQAAQQATLQQQETERQQEEAAKANVVDEAVEWQQLFLNNRPSQNEFRRIRMCIVQREDTLEEIAGRYNINPREILTANNLHESAITEGQLLYIP